MNHAGAEIHLRAGLEMKFCKNKCGRASCDTQRSYKPTAEPLAAFVGRKGAINKWPLEKTHCPDIET
jgi:hypothetical protein